MIKNKKIYVQLVESQAGKPGQSRKIAGHAGREMGLNSEGVRSIAMWWFEKDRFECEYRRVMQTGRWCELSSSNRSVIPNRSN